MKTIDMTPTWEGVLPVLIMTLQRSKVDSDSLETAQTELNKMAKLADKWVQHVKEMEREI